MKTFSKMFRWIIWVLILALPILYILGAYAQKSIFTYVGAAILVVTFCIVLLMWVYIRRKLRKFSLDLYGILSTSENDALFDCPMPVIIALDSGEILWYNTLCQNEVFMSDEMNGRNVGELLSGLTLHGTEHGSAGQSVIYGKNRYSAFIMRRTKNDTAVNVIYLVNDTELKNYKERYLRTRITVMVIMIDNYEEILQSARENERSQVLPEIEYTVSSFMKEYNGILCKTERDKFLAVMEETSMQKIISSRFALLDEVRKIEVMQRVPATLSIGVGRRAATLAEAENMARQALDMALGRGGDQAAVKTQNGYEFYGGVSKGIEKRTKVKTRIVATALTELILGSSNVIIMGHRFADLDCVGSAVGICKAVHLLGKDARIAINKQRNLSGVLLNKMEQEGYGGIFCNPEELVESITQETLLIIVDVHSKHFIESSDIYERCKSVVVIDHHRKMVDYIDNAVIFYHEPYASSASEMVAELVQYFGMKKNLGRVEAEALLAGIMLDTKNFVMKAGVRTFEAAAYLKRLGADTVEVRKLFASPMESYQKKARLVSSATVYRHCAIAISAGVVEDIKLIAPQAADDLMSISDVDASFVIFENGPQVEISARSMGAVNVQVIMEKLGGGGHLNMAAAQITGIDIEDAHQMLLDAIDDYFDHQSAVKEPKVAKQSI